MDRDKELLCGRVYGEVHDHPRPGLKPGRAYAELPGITGWTLDKIDDGASPRTELGQFGPGGRALYDPRPGDAVRWYWVGDSA
ncbi:hypothetical protein BJY54_006919 [Streptomyces nodosus]|uniref:Uncharacterized protein n=1 Tax=Streptomyces nodosus TaxID=40318 RepID=A0A5P2VWR1_9ACTN|nr:hypothetical protein [Streptomyces nodosus]MBB4796215.1 hypothetical protein [Streptomyces nodosus]QEV37232.1 hypothetical protein CP978_00240 [Streptomyces nodosus]